MSRPKKRKASCAACERPLRKGFARKAWVLTRDGAVHGLVCVRCAFGALPFVVPPPTTVAPVCSCCRRALASVCGGCAERLGASVRELTAANVALVARKKAP